MSRLSDSPLPVLTATQSAAREISNRARRSGGIAASAEPFSRAVTREAASMQPARPTARSRPGKPEPAMEARADRPDDRPARLTRRATTRLSAARRSAPAQAPEHNSEVGPGEPAAKRSDATRPFIGGATAVRARTRGDIEPESVDPTKTASVDGVDAKSTPDAHSSVDAESTPDATVIGVAATALPTGATAVTVDDGTRASTTSAVTTAVTQPAAPGASPAGAAPAGAPAPATGAPVPSTGSAGSAPGLAVEAASTTAPTSGLSGAAASPGATRRGAAPAVTTAGASASAGVTTTDVAAAAEADHAATSGFSGTAAVVIGGESVLEPASDPPVTEDSAGAAVQVGAAAKTATGGAGANAGGTGGGTLPVPSEDADGETLPTGSFDAAAGDALIGAPTESATVAPSAQSSAQPSAPVAQPSAAPSAGAGVPASVAANATAPTPAAAVLSTAPGAPVPTPVPTPATQLAPQLMALARTSRESQSMIVRLTPEELGPVELRVDVGRDGVSIRLTGMHEATREVLRTHLPELRRDLEDGGLSDVGLDVASDAGNFTDTGAREEPVKAGSVSPYRRHARDGPDPADRPPVDAGTGAGTRLLDFLA